MSDLSWLNPTPRAIAVYASQPLSPAATQHSLPSRRYPLLEPDFHRLDRTSLRLAHLFDHLVGEREYLCRHVEAERVGGHDTEDQFVLGWRLNWQVAWLCAPENGRHVMRAGTAIGMGVACAVAHQTAG